MDNKQEVISRVLDIKLVIAQISRSNDKSMRDNLCEYIEDLSEEILKILDARS